jgi:hypothetical protein
MGQMRDGRLLINTPSRGLTHDLNDVQTEVLIRERGNIVQNDRHPLSPALWC